MAAAARKADKQDDNKGSLVVTAQFAYAHAKSGEVRQLARGDVIDPSQFREESIEHLKSIGFLSDN